MFFLVADHCELFSNIWILDFGCFYHACPVHEWFSTYEHVDDEIVLLGDNARLNVIGIGIVKFKVSDGVVRMLL